MMTWLVHRAATIVLREDNCHFLRVDKDDFNRILRVSGIAFALSILKILCNCQNGRL